MAHIADLERIVGPPQYPSAPPDWGEVETKIGLQLPADYKRLFELYGYLNFDNYLMVYHPGLDSNTYRLGVIQALDALRTLTLGQDRIRLVDDHGNSLGYTTPFPFFPEGGGLFPWGVTEGGHTCMWLTSAASPEDWPVVVSAGSAWWRYPGSFVDFLVELMNFSVRCPIFPEDFPQSSLVHQFSVDEFK